MLLHLTSLPGGRLGDAAYRFADWLAEAGQTWWQLLPLGPPDRYRSPYKAKSAFAAWPGLLADPRGAGVAPRPRRRSASARRSGSRTGAASAGAARSPTRSASTREWAALRAVLRRARHPAVRRRGDLRRPGSADHRAHPELFQSGAVAGAPPDAFTELGQLWGNPLYDWPALRRRGYRWWVERIRRTLELFDAVRIDHFRGFVAYWAVPEDAADARAGRWKRGPGARAVRAPSKRELGTLPFVAEDLGVITPPVERLRDELGLPGMLVLQFGFDPDDPHGPHRFENHVENRFVYTGTHDHDTARGWYESLSAPRRAAVDAEFAARGVHEPEPWWGLVSAGAALAGAGGDDPGPGRPRPRQRGADERPGPAARQLALAAAGALASSWPAGCATPPRLRAAQPEASGRVRFRPGRRT